MDDELIYKFKKGDHKAWKTIYGMFIHEIILFAFRLTSNVMVAEEIAQDAFIKVIRFTEVKNLEELKRLFFTVTRNACFDYLRKVERERKSLNQYSFLKADSEEMNDLAKLEFEYAELIKQIHTLISSQPPQRKKVLECLVMEEMSPKEIANFLSINISGVYKHRDEFLKVLENNNIKDISALL